MKRGSWRGARPGRNKPANQVHIRVVHHAEAIATDVAGFALRRWIQNPRIVKTVDYGPRWRGHFVAVRSQADLDGELRAWLQEAHDTVGVQDDLAHPLHRSGHEAASSQRFQPPEARRSKSSRGRVRRG